ncbi:MAG: Ig-like domain-containing protein [Gemmatimonadetes bacterium]|nr:Ig-like domain-containing protein [Gemmatimonadota bacterium]
MRARNRSALAFMALCAVTTSACSRENGTLGPAPFPNTPAIFTDNFGPGVGFEAFGGSKLDAISVDNTVKRSGTSSLKVTIPGPNNPSGGYAGGAFVANVARDLTGYNALTFWARASIPAQLNVAGLGNDNTGNSLYTAERSNIAITTNWAKYAIAIPLAAKLSQEKGLFFFAEGPENGAGYELWLDDIRFEALATVTNVRPTIPGGAVVEEIGATRRITGGAVTVSVDGADQTVSAMPAYFTYTSSNPGVATVSAAGTVTVVGAGTANITASLGSTAAVGTVALTAIAPPTGAAPTPTRLAANVISLFSNAYTNVPVDTWSAVWDQADVTDVTIGGNATKKYTNLTFAGIEFTSSPINATAMTHLHLDVHMPDASAFKVKLVDFGANGAFGGGDDSEHTVTLNTTSNPAVTAGAWSGLDIPLAAFSGLRGRTKLAQMIIEGASKTVYVDNVYFYRVPAPTAPPTPAPTPTVAANKVISLFSNAYVNRTVDTWSASWDAADVKDTTIAGNDVKKYSNLAFAGVEFTSTVVDASAMTHFHLDYWSPDATSGGAAFKIKLVDFGPNRTFGGGDDVEHELVFNATSTPALATGSWVGFDIPLASFTGLTRKGALAQMILVGDDPINTVFIDNVYFYSNATPTEPLVAAPTPSYAAGDVIALFSNAYANRAVDTWSAGWDQADVADVLVAGNATKKYTNLTFAGIEFTSAPVNATSMTHFRLDFWSPDATTGGATFKVKLVDFGANGAFGGGDDKEHELVFTAASTPAIATGSWVTLDIPLTAFTGLVTRGNLAQLIFVGDDPINTVFIDNVLFHR